MNKEYINKINFLIEDEHEAIDGYNKVIDFFETSAESQKNLIIEQLEHIKEEEEEHIRELEELKKMLVDKSYTPKLDILTESKNSFTSEDAKVIAQEDLDNGILSAMLLLKDKYGFDISYYLDNINELEDVDSSGIDKDSGKYYDNANIYYRDKQFEKLGIKELMEKAYDDVWEEDSLEVLDV